MRRYVQLLNMFMKNGSFIVAVYFLMLLPGSTACQRFPTNTDLERMEENRKNLHLLKAGLTKTEVIAIMGRPDDTALYPRYAEHLEYWKYFTETRGALDFRYTDSAYKFLAFENGILRAWGKDVDVIPVKNNSP